MIKLEDSLRNVSWENMYLRRQVDMLTSRAQKSPAKTKKRLIVKGPTKVQLLPTLPISNCITAFAHISGAPITADHTCN